MGDMLLEIESTFLPDLSRVEGTRGAQKEG